MLKLMLVNVCLKEVDQSRFDSEEGQPRTRTRKRARLDQGALLLLTTCEL